MPVTSGVLFIDGYRMGKSDEGLNIVLFTFCVFRVWFYQGIIYSLNCESVSEPRHLELQKSRQKKSRLKFWLGKILVVSPKKNDQFSVKTSLFTS